MTAGARDRAFHPSLGPATHYVLYPDGVESMAMPEANARDCAKLFGGEVRRCEPGPEGEGARAPLWARLAPAAALASIAALGVIYLLLR